MPPWAEIAENDGETNVAQAAPDARGQDPGHEEDHPRCEERSEIAESLRVQDVNGEEVSDGREQEACGRCAGDAGEAHGRDDRRARVVRATQAECRQTSRRATPLSPIRASIAPTVATVVARK